MKKPYNYLIIDTETANTFSDGKNLDTSSALVYDIGIGVIDRNGNYLEKHSLINSDIFFQNGIMKSAYYASKIPTYWEGIKNGSRKFSTTYGINKLIKTLAEQYKIKAIIAHNARFDVSALNSTIRYISKSKTRYFLPYGIPIWDTLKMARQVINPLKKYTKFCDTYGYKTKNNQNRLTAEVLYRFISGNNDFIESHTGMEDIDIEKEIFARCMKAHKKIDKALW